MGIFRRRRTEKHVKQRAFSMPSCSARHHHHHQASFVSTQFRGRVGKTSLKNKASCSTSTSSSSSNNSGRAGVRCFAAISKPWDVQKPCKLVLEDGSVWQGKAFGAEGTKIGEVVFNTSLSGYQEILTDPSYAGQFVFSRARTLGMSASTRSIWNPRKCTWALL